MKFTQFVKQFRDANPDLKMTHSECMKHPQIKKAFKEVAGKGICVNTRDGDVTINVNDAQPAQVSGPRYGKKKGTMAPQAGTQRAGPAIPPPYPFPPSPPGENIQMVRTVPQTQSPSAPATESEVVPTFEQEAELPAAVGEKKTYKEPSFDAFGNELNPFEDIGEDEFADAVDPGEDVFGSVKQGAKTGAKTALSSAAAKAAFGTASDYEERQAKKATQPKQLSRPTMAQQETTDTRKQQQETTDTRTAEQRVEDSLNELRGSADNLETQKGQTSFAENFMRNPIQTTFDYGTKKMGEAVKKKIDNPVKTVLETQAVAEGYTPLDPIFAKLVGKFADYVPGVDSSLARDIGNFVTNAKEQYGMLKPESVQFLKDTADMAMKGALTAATAAKFMAPLAQVLGNVMKTMAETAYNNPQAFIALTNPAYAITGSGIGQLDCKPAVSGTGIKADELRNLLEASYTGTPSLGGDWQIDRRLSSANSKTFRKRSTGQVVVAHKGTQGTTDWGNNLVYALTGEAGYKKTNRYKEAKAVQDAAERKYGADNITTIGHSQGGLQAQMLGQNSREIITVNKATRPGEVAYGSSKKKNQYDVRSSNDPVSAFRSPLSGKDGRTVEIKSKTADPLAEHSYNVLESLGDTCIGDNRYCGSGIAGKQHGFNDSALAEFEKQWKDRLYKGEFNNPMEWDSANKKWVNVKAYRSALAKMEPLRKKAYKDLMVRLDKERDREAKLLIKSRKK